MVDMISAGTLPCAASGGRDGHGQVKLSLSYTSQERKLIVVVHACRCVCPPNRLLHQGHSGLCSLQGFCGSIVKWFAHLPCKQSA